MMANGTLKASSWLARCKLHLNPLRLLPRYLDPRPFCHFSNRMTSAQDTLEVALDSGGSYSLAPAVDRVAPTGIHAKQIPVF